MTPPRPAREKKESPWLALYRRLVARMTSLPSLRLEENGKGGAVFLHTASGSKLATLKIGAKGIEVGLRLSRSMPRSERLVASRKSPVWVTHRVLIASATQIDEEFLAWVKVARLQAGNAKSKSTSRAKRL